MFSSTPSLSSSTTSTFGQTTTLNSSSTNQFEMGTRGFSGFGHTPSQFGTSMGTRGPSGFGQTSSLNVSSTNQFGTSMETTEPFSFVTPGSIGTKGPFSTSYTGTIVYDDNNSTHNRMVSISAMPDYKLKSHEELKWEDYHLFNARGRVDPAFVHPNAFSFPRTDTSIFSRPLPTFFPSYQTDVKSVLDKIEGLDKSAQLLCKDIKCCQEDIKRFDKYRYLEFENILLDNATRNAIIADYLQSQAFTKRLDEEYERRLSKIFHPCYVKTLCEAQAKLPDHAFKLLFGQTSNLNASSTIPFGSQFMSGQSSGTNMFGSNSTSAGGTSMGLFGSMQETPLWGSSSGFCDYYIHSTVFDDLF